MVKTLFDENGNEVKAYTEDEMNEQAEKIKGLEEDIGKMKSNAENIKLLREKAEKGEKLSGKEEELLRKQKELEEEKKTWAERVQQEWKDEAYMAFSSGDEELKKKMEYFFDNELAGKAETKEEIMAKARKAFILATEGKKNPNPIYRAISARGMPMEEEGTKKKSFADTEQGRREAELMGLSVDLPKKE